MSIYDLCQTKDLRKYGLKNPLSELNKEFIFVDKPQEVYKMKAKIHAIVKLDDGKHEGKIVNIEFREKPFEYVDVIIEEKETQCTIKAGLPFYISENSSLGLVLQNFGATLEVGKDIDYADHIKPGTEVTFLTKNVKKDGKEFCNIINDTLKPKK